MSEDWGFALPAFKPEEALQRLRRDLRELGLVERAGVFEQRGSAAISAASRSAGVRVSSASK